MKFLHTLNQSYLGIDLAYLKKNSTYTMLAYIVSLVTTFVTTYAIANFLDEHTVGVYRYVYSWYGLISIFMLGGMASAITVAIAQNKNALIQAIRYKAIASIFGLLIPVFISLYYLHNQNIELFLAFFALAVSAPILEVSSVFSSYFQGKEDFRRNAILSILAKVTSLICILIAIFYFKSAHALIFATILCVGIIQLVYGYRFYKKEANKIKNLLLENKDPLEDKTLLKDSFHFSTMGIIYTLGSQADKIILFTFFGSTALASYWIATTVGLEAQRFITQFFSIYFPKLAKTDSAEHTHHVFFKRKVFKVMFISSAGLFACSILYFQIAPYIFELLFPPYLGQVIVSQVFFFTVALTPFLLTWQYFLAKKKTRLMYYYHTFDPILQILLYIILIPPFGIFGIIYAIIIKNIVVSIWGLYLFNKSV